MQFNQALPPRRLSGFLSFTQRYRIFLVSIGAVWMVAILGLGLTLESGRVGTIIMFVLTALMCVATYATPRGARWFTERLGFAPHSFYLVTLALDTLIISAMVPLTGGPISIVFVFYYLLAIGNCYAFAGKELVVANSFISVAYAGALLSMGSSPYAPKLLDWADILLIRIPLIFFISYFAQWLVRRGDRVAEAEQRQYLTTLQGFLTALELRDGYTKQHSSNVGRWCALFGQALGLTQDDQAVLLHAGELHDIGKIGVPDAILNKPGKLTTEEMSVMQAHAALGVQITEHIAWFTPEHQAIVRHHHEKWDGTGYPDGLTGTAIPYPARVAALCDVFDALTNDRPYRQGMPASRAVALIQSGMGTHFDPALCRRFLGLIADLQYCLCEQLGVADFNAVTWSGARGRLRTLDATNGEGYTEISYTGSGWQVHRG